MQRMHVALAPPSWVGESLSYRLRPREKRSFRTPLDANDLFVVDGASTVGWTDVDGTLVLDVKVEMKRGRIEERVEHSKDMTLKRLERRIFSTGGERSREEIVEFAANTHKLPDNTYVDTAAPFVLSGMPWDGKARSIYLWICDRFVAKVYYESKGNQTTTVPAGRFDTTEVLLYPDLNDWVPLPGVITKLSKPFLPKYHMWYERTSRRLVRFEGSLGPPGAPEVVIELA